MNEVKYIVMHCTAGPQTQTVEQIKKYWKDELKWRGVGYHFIVEPDGVIEQLASVKTIVNGVKGHNSHAIHIAYIGGMNGDDRTEAQKEAIDHKLKQLRKLFPDAEILGHRDLSPDLDGDGIIEPHEWVKLCPNYNAKQEHSAI